MKKFSRALAWLLALVMIVSMLPAAFAAEEAAPIEVLNADEAIDPTIPIFENPQYSFAERAADLVARVKSYRDLTRTGTFWRLLSPFEGPDTAWSFVSEDRREVLFCAYRSLSVPNTAPLRVRLRGLLPDAWYLSDDGATYNSAVLMNHGVTVRLRGDFSSFVLHLKAE